jgi:hypothetical protein
VEGDVDRRTRCVEFAPDSSRREMDSNLRFRAFLSLLRPIYEALRKVVGDGLKDTLVVREKDKPKSKRAQKRP